MTSINRGHNKSQLEIREEVVLLRESLFFVTFSINFSESPDLI
jgi:hypothetical protein